MTSTHTLSLSLSLSHSPLSLTFPFSVPLFLPHYCWSIWLLPSFSIFFLILFSLSALIPSSQFLSFFLTFFLSLFVCLSFVLFLSSPPPSVNDFKSVCHMWGWGCVSVCVYYCICLQDYYYTHDMYNWDIFLSKPTLQEHVYIDATICYWRDILNKTWTIF